MIQTVACACDAVVTFETFGTDLCDSSVMSVLYISIVLNVVLVK